MIEGFPVQRINKFQRLQTRENHLTSANHSTHEYEYLPAHYVFMEGHSGQLTHFSIKNNVSESHQNVAVMQYYLGRNLRNFYYFYCLLPFFSSDKSTR